MISPGRRRASSAPDAPGGEVGQGPVRAAAGSRRPAWAHLLADSGCPAKVSRRWWRPRHDCCDRCPCSRPTASWSGADLAGRLGVSSRTLCRHATGFGMLYSSMPARKPAAVTNWAGAELPPLLLDDDQARRRCGLPRTAADRGIEGIGETSVRALAKLEQVLPDRLRRPGGTLNAVTVPMLRGPASRCRDPAGLNALLAPACPLHRTPAFRIPRPRRRDEPPHRGTAPSGVLERRWNPAAWDLGREDWRTFRVDRLTPKPPHGPRFVPREPPAEDLAAYVSRGVSTRVYASQAAIRLLVPVEEATERISPSVGTLRAEGPDACVLTTGRRSPPRPGGPRDAAGLRVPGAGAGRARRDHHGPRPALPRPGPGGGIRARRVYAGSLRPDRAERSRTGRSRAGPVPGPPVPGGGVGGSCEGTTSFPGPALQGRKLLPPLTEWMVYVGVSSGALRRVYPRPRSGPDYVRPRQRRPVPVTEV
ncbi:hypothetical protein SHIRM173S_06540 [Streptomyces hirsutus]